MYQYYNIQSWMVVYSKTDNSTINGLKKVYSVNTENINTKKNYKGIIKYQQPQRPFIFQTNKGKKINITMMRKKV